jgi:hypothetical protein
MWASAEGGHVLAYQWYFSGTNSIESATNSVLLLSNVQPAQAGPYTVVVTNLFGAATSSPAMLNVLLVPPTILKSPVTQTAMRLSGVRLSVMASGSLPMSYQWYFNSNIVTSGTNRVLMLPGVQASNAGVYEVVCSNALASTNSQPALLNVIAPVQQRMVPAMGLTADVGSVLHLEYANTLAPDAPWRDLDVVTMTASPRFYPDAAQPQAPSRYYRAWQFGTPNTQPLLQMIQATELTFIGDPGSQLRVDYINQFGPTDAWVTLDAVLLTNATQSYFDFSAFNQPARLYRLVPVP